MTRIEKTFAELRKQGRKGFIAYVTAGDPSLGDTFDIVRRLDDAGVDVVELGIPFSDPLADGRVNQDAATRALASGTTVAGVVGLVERLRRETEVPLLFFSYLNPLFANGFEKVVQGAARAGIDGFLVLDLSVEEAAPYAQVMEKHGVNNVCLVAPTSPEDRIRRIVRHASGFVYCVSREGVTGTQDHIAGGARELVARTKNVTSLPVALGFGISTPDQARAAAQFADAVVVGSAIVDRFHRAGPTARARAKTAAWVAQLVRAVKEV